jgi:hypothetical protein
VITKYKAITSIVFFLLFSSVIASADSPITVNTKTDKPKATTGDLILYTITVIHDLDIKPSKPDFSLINQFDVLKAVTKEPIQTGDKSEQEYSVKLRADKVGIYTIPPIPISFQVIKKNQSKPISGKINAPKITIEVVSILRDQGEPTDILDINDLLEVDKDWVPIIFWGLNLILLIIVLYTIWKYREVKQSKNNVRTRDTPIHEIALNELDALKLKDFLNCGDSRKHFFEISEIFRRYLGKRYSFPAPDWTTEEITKYFQKENKLELFQRDEIIRILDKSDLIKFAKIQVKSDADEIESVRKIITSTRERLDIGLYSN